MSLKKILLLTVCLGLLFAAVCFAGSVDMEEGKWEITTKMEMAGMAFAMPGMTQTMCLSEEDMIPQEGVNAQSSGCTVKSQTVSGNTVKWEVVCDTEGGKTTSTGHITYNGDSFEGAVNMDVPGAGPMQQTMTGRRIGNCN